MMIYKEKDLKNKVIEEAKNLLVHAHDCERQNLDVSRLDHAVKYYCIYGQMTGNCFGTRATDLLNLCAKPYSNDLYERDEPKRSVFNVGDVRCEEAFSPIEFYISLPKAKNATLIAFLRGERETLTVDDL